jgi:Zn-dependent protease with chaperone function
MQATETEDWRTPFTPKAELSTDDPRLVSLVMEAFSRIPRGTPALHTLRRLLFRKRAATVGLVGLTRYRFPEYSVEDGRTKQGVGRHIITFYTGLLIRLSRPAALGVVAHELAHAWLNEHVAPEESEKREEEADRLADMWGFGKELRALAAETEPL